MNIGNAFRAHCPRRSKRYEVRRRTRGRESSLRVWKVLQKLLEQSEVEKKMRPGVIIEGMVLAVGSEYVTVHAGLKSESTIPVGQFRNESGEVEVAVGDRVEVAPRHGGGRVRLHQALAGEGEAGQGVEPPGGRVRRRGIRDRGHQRQGQGRIHRRRRRHPGVPARVARRCAPGARHLLPRRQAAGVQGDQARSPAQQRRGLAARGWSRRRTPPSARRCSRACRRGRYCPGWSRT